MCDESDSSESSIESLPRGLQGNRLESIDDANFSDEDDVDDEIDEVCLCVFLAFHLQLHFRYNKNMCRILSSDVTIVITLSLCGEFVQLNRV